MAKTQSKSAKASAKNSKTAKASPAPKKSEGKLVILEDNAPRGARVSIDEKAIGTELAKNIVTDFDAEVTAQMSKNNKCFVINFTHKKYDIAILVYKNGKIFVKALLCENALFNNAVRTFIGTEESPVQDIVRKFVRLAFLKDMQEKAIALPYVPSPKESIQ